MYCNMLVRGQKTERRQSCQKPPKQGERIDTEEDRRGWTASDGNGSGAFHPTGAEFVIHSKMLVKQN